MPVVNVQMIVVVQLRRGFIFSPFIKHLDKALSLEVDYETKWCEFELSHVQVASRSS
jgi:hypothetical protein